MARSLNEINDNIKILQQLAHSLLRELQDHPDLTKAGQQQAYNNLSQASSGAGGAMIALRDKRRKKPTA